MNKPKITFAAVFSLIVCLFSLTNIFAQTDMKQIQAEPNYDVILHVLTGSNNANDKSSVPQPLSNVVKKLKTIYSYSNYGLDSTYIQRIANKGSLEFKGVSNETDQSRENYTPIFSEWIFGSLQNLPNGGRNFFQFENFRFGQRVPIKSGALKDADGKTNNVFNYEQIGLTLKKFGVPENVPTVIGSLSASKPDELMFLILTVKAADQ